MKESTTTMKQNTRERDIIVKGRSKGESRHTSQVKNDENKKGQRGNAGPVLSPRKSGGRREGGKGGMKAGGKSIFS